MLQCSDRCRKCWLLVPQNTSSAAHSRQEDPIGAHTVQLLAQPGRDWPGQWDRDPMRTRTVVLATVWSAPLHASHPWLCCRRQTPVQSRWSPAWNSAHKRLDPISHTVHEMIAWSTGAPNPVECCGRKLACRFSLWHQKRPESTETLRMQHWTRLHRRECVPGWC